VEDLIFVGQTRGGVSLLITWTDTKVDLLGFLRVFASQGFLYCLLVHGVALMAEHKKSDLVQVGEVSLPGAFFLEGNWVW
jgi:hypothetical protein